MSTDTTGIHHVTAIGGAPQRNVDFYVFEVATDPPGFAVDELPSEMGTSLKLPPRYESRRDHLESLLPELRVPSGVSAE